MRWVIAGIIEIGLKRDGERPSEKVKYFMMLLFGKTFLKISESIMNSIKLETSPQALCGCEPFREAPLPNIGALSFLPHWQRPSMLSNWECLKIEAAQKSVCRDLCMFHGVGTDDDERSPLLDGATPPPSRLSDPSVSSSRRTANNSRQY